MVEVFWTFLRLGLTSFGGPIAHIGYFRSALVERRRWLSEATFAEVVAICQFLPGPASSQVGLAIGLIRAGMPGALGAWLGFTLPSALLMAAFAYGIVETGVLGPALLHGIAVAVVAVVANAVIGMARGLLVGWRSVVIACLALAIVLGVAGAIGHLAAIMTGLLIGRFFLSDGGAGAGAGLAVPIGRTFAAGCLLALVALLVALPLAAATSGAEPIRLFDGFFRSGALVFGGGHVILPLLRAEVLPPGWIDEQAFVTGYGAAQMVPGPLFTFAAYLGTVIGGAATAALATVAIFLPSVLLVFGVLPFWIEVRQNGAIRRALAGANAAVVGVLAAALYDPLILAGIRGPVDVALALAGIVALRASAPAPAVVALIVALAFAFAQ